MKNRMSIYWSHKLNCSADRFATEGLHLVPRDKSLITGLISFKSTVIALPKDRFEYFSEKLGPLNEKHLVTYIDIINLLHDDIKECGYILYQGYAEKEDFTPSSTADVRIIKEEETGLLEDLQKETPLIEWQHSGMDKKIDSDLFGYFLNGHVVAVANYLLWGDQSASIGVLTHPSYRNRGYCKSVASAVMNQAFENGLFVVYQTILENKPSIAMAQKLGVKDFGVSFKLIV